MEIQAIKASLSIVKVLEHYQVKVDKNHRALCPFHPDKTPSLQLYPKTNTYCCFSTRCKAGTGDQIQFIQLKEKCSKHQALVKASQLAASSIPASSPMNKAKATSTPSKVAAKDKASPKDATAVQARAAFFTPLFSSLNHALKVSKPAQEYLQSRGLNHKQTETGYNSGTMHQRLNRQQIEKHCHYGLIKPNASGEYTAWAKGCIVFALRNKENQVVSLYGRSIYNKTNNRHFYLSDSQGLYPSYPPASAKTLILTESVIDAASLLQSGAVPETAAVLALYGTNRLNEEHLEAITALPHLEEIIFFLNGDEAGREAEKKHRVTLLKLCEQLQRNISISQVETPEGEDINSLWQSYENPAVFTELLTKKSLSSSIEKKERPQENATESSIQQLSLNFKTNALQVIHPYKFSYKGQGAQYIVMGGLRKELDSLKITLAVETLEAAQEALLKQKYRTKLDLYEDKQVERIGREAAEKLGIRSDLIQVDLHHLTGLLEDYREKELVKSPGENTPARPAIPLSKEMQHKCQEFLQQPELLLRINEVIGKAGVVGEESNRMLLFMIASSYKMADCLHGIVQGTSGSGKTHLISQITEFMPPEDTLCITRATDSTFYNYREHELSHKLLVMEDLDGLEEKALLAFRELISRGMVNSSTTTKDEQGNSHSIVKTVRGPIASLSATTKGAVYEDNMNRSFLIAVDESQAQTHRIITYQNSKSAGEIDQGQEAALKIFLQHCIRLLKPYPVINPYASKVQLPIEARNLRRLNAYYQSLVKQITLLHQYQRKRKSMTHSKEQNPQALLSEKEDLQMACDILFDSIVLKVDELDGSLRSFYEQLKTYIKPKGRQGEFTLREIRQGLNIPKSSLHRYMEDLLKLEYIHQTGGFVNKGLRYKIQYWDDITTLRENIKKHLQRQLDKL